MAVDMINNICTCALGHNEVQLTPQPDGSKTCNITVPSVNLSLLPGCPHGGAQLCTGPDFHEEYRDLVAERSALEGQVTTLTQERDDAVAAHANCATEKSDLEGQVTTLTQEKSDLEGQVTTLTQEKNEAVAAHANCATTIAEKEAEIQRLNDRLDELSAQETPAATYDASSGRVTFNNILGNPCTFSVGLTLSHAQRFIQGTLPATTTGAAMYKNYLGQAQVTDTNTSPTAITTNFINKVNADEAAFANVSSSLSEANQMLGAGVIPMADSDAGRNYVQCSQPNNSMRLADINLIKAGNLPMGVPYPVADTLAKIDMETLRELVAGAANEANDGDGTTKETPYIHPAMVIWEEIRTLFGAETEWT